MLKLRKLNYRPWPVGVTLQECLEATGEVVEVRQTFVAHFRPFTEDEFMLAREAALAAVPPPAGSEESSPPMQVVLRRNTVFFGALLCGWGADVLDETGAPLPYSAEALTALVTGPDGIAVSAGVNQALLELRFGMAPQKNLRPSPAPGPIAAEAAAAGTSAP